MSIFGYLERVDREMPGRSVLVAGLVGQEPKEADSVEVPEKIEVYGTVDDYDPVLRSHCRLQTGAGQARSVT
jgi:hypothetical protein